MVSYIYDEIRNKQNITCFQVYEQMKTQKLKLIKK